MTARHPQPSSREDESRAPVRSPAPVEPPGEDVRRLGKALSARIEDVVEGTVARATAAGTVVVDPRVKSSFDRICRISTLALANWMAGGSPEDGRKASKEALEHHGQMAAPRD